MPSRQQAIIWSNDDLVYLCMYASLRHSDMSCIKIQYYMIFWFRLQFSMIMTNLANRSDSELTANTPYPAPLIGELWWAMGAMRCLLWVFWRQLNILHSLTVTCCHINSLAPGKFEWNSNFQIDFSDWWLRHLLWNCPNMNVIGLHWWSVNIGSGNGLVPSGNKPLPEPMLTQISVSTWRH